MTSDKVIVLSRLVWAAPLTIISAATAVWVCQHLALAVLPPLPRFSGSVLAGSGPVVVTAVLVTIAVVLFPLVVGVADDHSAEPLRAYRRIALGALLVSCIPNLLPLLSGVVDLGMFALMALHVVAWAVTVTMLTRLTAVRRRESPALT